MDPAAYKAAKERFVSGLTGTTAWEVQWTVSVALAAYLFWKACRSSFAASWEGSPLFVLDFAVIVLPLMLSFTAPATATWLILGLGGAGGLYTLSRWYHAARKERPVGVGPTAEERALMVSLADARKPFLDVYRSMMMLSTCLAILAVDFPIFPRRFAKTETWGTSLMDVGVGSFVLVNSLTAGNSLEQLRDAASPFLHSLKASVPLVILGLGRLVSVKATDYQEHVSEYGVHWNFFFTLACLPILSMIVHRLVRRLSRLGVVGLIVAVGYQLALSLTPLQDYILNGERTDLLSANKEGVFSVLGYFAIFAVGTQLGAMLLRRKALAEWRFTVVRLLVADAVLWGLWWLCTGMLDIQTSRRLANLPYVLFTLAYNLPFLALLLGMDLAVGFTRKGLIYPAINRNMLFTFLLANVLTGAVNFSMPTLYTPDPLAFAVLLAYMLTITVVAAVLHASNMTLKAW